MVSQDLEKMAMRLSRDPGIRARGLAEFIVERLLGFSVSEDARREAKELVRTHIESEIWAVLGEVQSDRANGR